MQWPAALLAPPAAADCQAIPHQGHQSVGWSHRTWIRGGLVTHTPPPKGQQLCFMSGWAALPQAASPGQQVLTGGAAATLAQKEEEEEKRVYVVPPSAEVASVFV